MNLEQIQFVPIDEIIVGSNVREQFDEQSIEGIAATAAEHGILQPIRVRRVSDKLVVVVGHRRLAGAKRGGLKKMPVIVEERELNAAEVIERQLIENSQRKNLNPVETAYAIQDLIDETQWSITEVATRLGFKICGVSKSLSLLKLPVETLDKVRSGEIPASTAYKLATIGDPIAQTELAQHVADKKLTRDAVTELVKQAKSRPRRSKPRKQQTIRVQCEDGIKIAISALDLGLDSVIKVIRHVLGVAEDAQAQGLGMDALIQAFKAKS